VPELASGTYKVVVSYGASTSATTIQLFSLNDLVNPVRVDADGGKTVGTTATDTKVTVADSTTGGEYDFGNGLKVTIGNFASGTTAEGVVSFGKGGSSYDLQLSKEVDAGKGTTLTASSSAAAFAQYMDDINNKLDVVSGQLAQIGSLTGRLTFKEDQISNAQINVESAYNRIMNADMASEQVESSKYVILQQTATAMLAQANSSPQFLLSLFK
jgi:flagellin